MEIATLLLEYIKVLLSPQCLAGLVTLVFFSRFRDDIRALMKRVASIRLPGGAELAAPQLERAAEEKAPKEPPALPAGAALPVPEGLHLTPEQAKAVAEVFRAERSKAYLWEYRYLNLFLVANTQHVLDWLASLPQRTTLSMYDAWWLPRIPSAEERRAIINALRTHYLIQIGDGELIEVTEKGREYAQWRGQMPDSAS